MGDYNEPNYYLRRFPRPQAQNIQVRNGELVIERTQPPQPHEVFLEELSPWIEETDTPQIVKRKKALFDELYEMTLTKFYRAGLRPFYTGQPQKEQKKEKPTMKDLFNEEPFKSMRENYGAEFIRSLSTSPSPAATDTRPATSLSEEKEGTGTPTNP